MKMNLKSLRKYSTAVLAAAVLAAGACYSCTPQKDGVQEAGLEPESDVDEERRRRKALLRRNVRRRKPSLLPRRPMWSMSADR